jgi:hypothetical protein
MAFVTPTNVTVGSVLTASRYNENVVDNMTALAPFFGAWTDYSPTWAQSATITHTKNHARFLQIGKLVMVSVRLTASSGGTATNVVSVTVPVNAARFGTFASTGAASIYDTSTTTTYVCSASFDGTGAVRFLHDTSAGNYFGNSPNVAIASGDILSFTIMYEAA